MDRDHNGSEWSARRLRLQEVLNENFGIIDTTVNQALHFITSEGFFIITWNKNITRRENPDKSHATLVQYSFAVEYCDPVNAND